MFPAPLLLPWPLPSPLLLEWLPPAAKMLPKPPRGWCSCGLQWESGGAAADLGAEAVAAPSAVVVAVGVVEEVVGRCCDEGAGLVFAEAVVYDVVVFVDAALHLAAAG